METRSKTRQVNLEIQFEGKKRITTTKLELKKSKGETKHVGRRYAEGSSVLQRA